MTLLIARNLAAAYDGRTVFSDIDLDLGPGAYVLTGRNGTGKSTLLRLLSGAQRPDAGSVSIDGRDLVRDPIEARLRLAYVPDESPAYPFMTGAELLHLVQTAKRAGDDPVVGGLIADFGLAPLMGARFDAISLGTQKKLLLAAGWIGRPCVILLDEPSNALDAAARHALVERIRADAASAVILFASHDAEFAVDTGATILPLEALAAAA
jgi:ABC-type multidrug transport system ATPase subunit